MMQQNALDILDRVTRGRMTKDQVKGGVVKKKGHLVWPRLEVLLRTAESDIPPGWVMHVPRCFDDALDIKLTTLMMDEKPTLVWTQGENFAFKAGDFICDTERADEPWSLRLRHIGVALQVRSATDATSPMPGVRSPGSVTFDVLLPSPDCTQLVPTGCRTLTQDDFIRLLITGDGLPL